jgi:hypothetical protein
MLQAPDERATIMTAMTIAEPSKLPLFRTIGQAYALWAGNFADLVRICWLWMLLMVPVLAIWDWWQTAHTADLLRAIEAGQPFVDPHPVLTLLSVLVSKVIMLPAVASVAVAWHRLLLRQEHPGPGAYLRLDKIVAGYAILAFLIGLIITVPSSVSIVLPQITTGSGATAAVVVQSLATLALIVAFFIVPRLSLVLPGIALGRDDATLATAWRVSKRNTWRMIWAYLFCLLPLIAISGWMSYWLFLSGHNRAVVTLVSIVIGLLWIPGGMVSVGVLSLAYRHFFEQRATSFETLPPPPLPPSPRRRRRYGWWVATGIVAALLALVAGGWVLYAEPIKLFTGWMITANPYLPGCRTTIVSEATEGQLWNRMADVSCADQTMHVVFVKRSDVPIPMLVFASVDGPVPTSVRETGENGFEIILATPLADGRTSVPLKLDQNGWIVDPQIFDHGRPIPVSDKTDIPDLFRTRSGEHRDSR